MAATRQLLAVVVLLLTTTLASADSVRGVVSQVDLDKKELVIEGRGLGVRGLVFRFTLGGDAKVAFGNQAANLGDLPAGRMVQVVYENQNGTRIALSVNATGSKPPAPKQAADNGLPMPRKVDNGGLPMPRKADDAGTVSGLLRRVAYTDREVVVAVAGEGGKEGYVSLPVADNARITRDDKPIKFDDLKEEERALVRTEMRNGKRVAIAVQTGKVSDKAMPPAVASEPSKIARARLILDIADTILQKIDQPEPRPYLLIADSILQQIEKANKK